MLVGLLDVSLQLLELSGNACRDNKRQRLIPRHIVLAMKNDEELNQFCAKVTCPGGGVLPFVHPVSFFGLNGTIRKVLICFSNFICLCHVIWTGLVLLVSPFMLPPYKDSCIVLLAKNIEFLTFASFLF